MKKMMLSLVVAASLLYACNKSASDSTAVSLTASTTEAAVGQTITVTANTRTNALSWSVTPANTASAAYAVTTEKTNYISFSQPGVYTVGVRTRDLFIGFYASLQPQRQHRAPCTGQCMEPPY